MHPPYPGHFDTCAFNEGIMVLGTTNQPWILEDELRRIFTYNIHVKLPNDKAREELLRMFLQNLHHNINDEQFKCLVAKSAGYSAADVNTVIRQAAHLPPSDPTKYIQHMPRVITYVSIQIKNINRGGKNHLIICSNHWITLTRIYTIC